MRDENMSYTVKSSERLRKSGSEAETKALLYLMNFRPDSDDIYYFVVDFFNDLTGMDNMASRLWDVQSKGAHHVSPKAIGKELVTLFKNYMSPLTFEAYILFIGSVTGSLRKDSSLTTFGIENVKDAAIEQIKLGLHEEGSAFQTEAKQDQMVRKTTMPTIVPSRSKISQASTDSTVSKLGGEIESSFLFPACRTVARSWPTSRDSVSNCS